MSEPIDASASHSTSRDVFRPAATLALACAAVCMASWLIGGGWSWNGYWLGKPTRFLAAFGVVLPAIVAVGAWTQLVVHPQRTRPRDWWATVASFTAVRLTLSSAFVITLDEAYHWQWSQHLALCYPDHPGVTAGLGWFGYQIFGPTLFAARLAPTLAGTLIVCFVYILARTLASQRPAYSKNSATPAPTAPALGPRQIAAAAGALAMITPTGAVASMLVSTDYPLAVVWAATPLLVLWAIRTNRMIAWASAGLCLGFGLNAKFLGVVLLGGVMLFLVADAVVRRIAGRDEAESRRGISTAGAGLMVAVAAVCIAPILYWNARHDWMTFVFNFARRVEVSGQANGNTIHWVLTQLGIVSPAVWVAVVVVGAARTWAAIRAPSTDPGHRAELVVLCTSFGPLVAYAVLSVVTMVGFHWTLPLYAPLVALTVVHLLAAAPLRRETGAERRRWWHPHAIVDHCAALAFAFTVGGLVTLAALMLTTQSAFRSVCGLFADQRHVNRLVGECLGWPLVAKEVDAMWRRSPKDDRPLVMTWIYKTCAVLHDHVREVPWVYVFNRDYPYGQAYQIWRDLDAQRGRDAIIVSLGPESTWHLEAYRRCFDSVERVPDDQRLSPAGSPARAFEVYRAVNFKGRDDLPPLPEFKKQLQREPIPARPE